MDGRSQKSTTTSYRNRLNNIRMNAGGCDPIDEAAELNLVDKDGNKIELSSE